MKRFALFTWSSSYLFWDKFDKLQNWWEKRGAGSIIVLLLSPSSAQKQSKKNYQAGDVLKEGCFGFRGQKLLLIKLGAQCSGWWLPSAVFDVQRWSCALVMVVVALSEKCCLKCCLVTALQSIWSKYRATGANKLPGGQTAQLSVQILTAWVDDDGTIRRLIRQIWQPYHFAYIPILYTIHHTAPFANNTSQ